MQSGCWELIHTIVYCSSSHMNHLVVQWLRAGVAQMAAVVKASVSCSQVELC